MCMVTIKSHKKSSPISMLSNIYFMIDFVVLRNSQTFKGWNVFFLHKLSCVDLGAQVHQFAYVSTHKHKIQWMHGWMDGSSSSIIFLLLSQEPWQVKCCQRTALFHWKDSNKNMYQSHVPSIVYIFCAYFDNLLQTFWCGDPTFYRFRMDGPRNCCK